MPRRSSFSSGFFYYSSSLFSFLWIACCVLATRTTERLFTGGIRKNGTRIPNCVVVRIPILGGCHISFRFILSTFISDGPIIGKRVLANNLPNICIYRWNIATLNTFWNNFEHLKPQVLERGRSSEWHQVNHRSSGSHTQKRTRTRKTNRKWIVVKHAKCYVDETRTDSNGWGEGEVGAINSVGGGWCLLACCWALAILFSASCNRTSTISKYIIQLKSKLKSTIKDEGQEDKKMRYLWLVSLLLRNVPTAPKFPFNCVPNAFHLYQMTRHKIYPPFVGRFV